jgi:prephenate dehydrogenase
MIQELRRCVVVGGAGAVGGMFTSLLIGSGAEVCVIDIKPPATAVQFEHGDITNLTPNVRTALEAADLVLLAIPESVALAAIAPVVAGMRSEALLAHTLSVQSPLASAWRGLGPRIQAVGLNPMFAPSLGIAGRPVAAIVLNDGPRVQELLRLVSAWGGRVVQLGAEEHDRLTAATQVLTHATVLAFGLALVDLNLDIDLLSALAPPPHATLLALLARIASGTPEVYWDIQSANPQAVAARAALARGLERLVESIKKEAAFTAVQQEGRKVLGAELEHYQEVCARIFNGLLLSPGRTS